MVRSWEFEATDLLPLERAVCNRCFRVPVQKMKVCMAQRTELLWFALKVAYRQQLTRLPYVLFSTEMWGYRS